MLKKIGEDREIIGIDLDETSCYTVRHVLEENKLSIGGIILEEKHITDYYLHKIPGLNINEKDAIEMFRNVYRNDLNKLLIQPIEEAKLKINEFIKKGYSNIIVTARDGLLFGDYTKKWLDKYYNNLINDILFANHFGKAEIPKSVLCKQYGINKMVEDNIDFSMELARNGIQTYILHKPWNYRRKDKHELLKRVEDWSEIEI